MGHQTNARSLKLRCSSPCHSCCQAPIDSSFHNLLWCWSLDLPATTSIYSGHHKALSMQIFHGSGLHLGACCCRLGFLRWPGQWTSFCSNSEHQPRSLTCSRSGTLCGCFWTQQMVLMDKEFLNSQKCYYIVFYFYTITIQQIQPWQWSFFWRLSERCSVNLMNIFKQHFEVMLHWIAFHCKVFKLLHPPSVNICLQCSLTWENDDKQQWLPHPEKQKHAKHMNFSSTVTEKVKKWLDTCALH